MALTARGATQDVVRRHNLSVLLGHVHRQGPTSRAELTRLLGLNRSTIGDLVDDLVARRLVEETSRLQHSAPGRPSKLVRARTDTVAVVAIAIEVETVNLAAVTLGGEVLERGEFACGGADERAFAPLVVRLCRAMRGLERKLPLGVELIGLGVAVPGVVCQHDGMVRVAPNLGWDETPVGKRLRERLGLPVVVGNDANLGAIAEHARGVAAGVDNLVYVHGEVGVGGGVISNGALLTGSAGYGGEVGHMRVNPQGSPCRCGSWGCWETEVGEDVLVAKAGRRSGGRPAVDKVLQAAAAGEPRAVAAVEDVARWLGVGLVNIAACYNPDMVVLGGLFATILSLAAPVIVAELSAGLTNSGHLDLVLVPPMLGDEAVLMGAAESAFDSLLGDPAQFPARSPARR